MDVAEWQTTVGDMLKRARGRMSKRSAAARAGLSEGMWRQLEDGYRTVQAGMQVPVNPRDETLVAAARAVGLDPADVLHAAGRDYTPPPEEDEEDEPSFADMLDDLDRRLTAVEALLDRVDARDLLPDLTPADWERIRQLAEEEEERIRNRERAPSR